MKKSKTYTHAPTENKVHIVTWSQEAQTFWCKELPYNLSDDEIYKWVSGNISNPNIKIFRGKELILRGKR